MKNAAFDQNLRRASWRYNARTVLTGLLAVLVVVGLFAAVIGGGPFLQNVDMAGAPLQQGVAVVTNVALQNTPRTNPAPWAWVTLRVPELSTPVVIYYPDTTLHEGDHVSLAYQVGKSGRVYVERIERLTAADRNEQGDFPR